MNAGLIGGITGIVIGGIGGAIGTYASIKNTNGPKAKAFMIKVSIIGWIAGIIFIALLVLLPGYYKYLLWIPYSVALPLSINYLNKKLREIENENKSEESK